MTKKERLNTLLNEGQEFVDKGLTSDNNKFIAWKNSLIRFIEQYYGKDSTIFKQFNDVKFSPSVYALGTPDTIFKEYFNDGMNEILEDLKRLIDEFDELDRAEKKVAKSNNPFMNIKIDNINKNENLNNNYNSICIKTYEEVREEIENNTYLDNDSIDELLLKLDEIKKIEISKDSKAKKWNAAKKILAFIIDKGADIAIMYIPLILQAISK